MSTGSYQSDPHRRGIDRVEYYLREAGVKYTRRAGHIQASCPIHGEDRKPSLSIDQRGDRVVMLCQTCQAGQDDITDAIGMHVDELWDVPGGECVVCGKRTIPDPATGELVHPHCADRRAGRIPSRSVSRLPAPRPRPARLGPLPQRLNKGPAKPRARRVTPDQITATYEHISLDGEVLARSVRVEWDYKITGDSEPHRDKRFYQERPDPSRAGEWRRGLDDDVEVPLWRAPEVAEAIADGRTIHLAEGHKDAERLLRAGVEATTNISGAGNLQPHHAEQLRGADVVVHVDRDPAGWRRGIKAHELLDGVAGRVRLVLPAVVAAKADATDHLDAGHALDELIPVTPEELHALLAADAVDQARQRLEIIPAEISDRRDRAVKARSKKAAETESAAAERWAAEAGRQLLKLHTALDGMSPQGREGAADAWAQAVDLVLEAHRTVGLPLADDVAAVIHHDDDDSDDDPVVEFPAREPVYRPEHPIQVAGRGEWRYSTGDGDTPAGVYYRPGKTQPYQPMADLPHVKARMVRRDASDRRVGTDYLIGVTEDSSHIVVTARTLGDGSWANQLGMPLSADPQVVRAVATAIIHYAAEHVPEKESAPQIDTATGRLQLPPQLPSGWLETSPSSRAEAIEAWRRIVTEATPIMAQVIGASAFAPFVRDTEVQPHVISLNGTKGTGKTLTLRAAAAIWGDPFVNSDLLDSWNTTANAALGIVGPLRLLPAFRDEAGTAGMSPAQWADALFRLTQGANRSRLNREHTATRSANWRGILFSTGNGEIRATATTGGKYDGLDRRLFDFSAIAFTRDRGHARRLAFGGEGLLYACYGHLGTMIVDNVTVDQAKALRSRARGWLAEPDTNLGCELYELAVCHVAGAMMIDELLGTGATLTAACVQHATDYLAGIEDVNDGDRIIEALLASLASEPNSWPTREEFEALDQPFDPDGVRLPLGGINAGDLLGIRHPDTGEVWVFDKQFRERLAADLNIQAGLRDLEARGLYWRQNTKQFRSLKRLRGGRQFVQVFRLGRLDLPPAPEPGPANEPPTGEPMDDPQLPTGSQQPAVTGGVTGRVTGDVTPPNPAVTRDVTGVTGETADSTCEGARGDQPAQTRASEYTAETTAGWGAAEFDQAVSDALDRQDWLAADALAALMDAREQAWRDARAKAAAARQAETPAPSQPKAPSRGKSARFVAPAATLDAERAYLPGGIVQSWQGRHLGDLALLVDELRLGHGGGAALPDPGQIWLFPDAIAKLGLPATMDLPERAMFADERRAETRRMYRAIADLPAIAGAIADGWELRQDHVDAWTRLAHPDLLPHGAVLVFLPWQRISDVPLWSDDPGPQVLVDRLAEAADVLGVSYQYTPAITATELIDHTRPPRRDPDEPVEYYPHQRGKKRAPYRLIRNERAEIPPFLLDRGDNRFTALEGDWSWWRTWEAAPGGRQHPLTDDERGRRYVHAWDRGGSHAAGWRADLGCEGLRHSVGADARWNGKDTQAGLWLVRQWEWPSWGLPDPADACGAHVEDGCLWVTTPTLRALQVCGIEPEIVESYTWATTSRYLDIAVDRIKAGREHSDPAIVSLVKQVYTHGTGRLNSRGGRPDYHLARPDWYFTIVAKARLGILLTCRTIAEATGQHPVAVAGRDTIFYVSDEADPSKAWPGSVDKLGTGIGQWKPAGTAPLAEWGPTHLAPGRAGTPFGYTAAMGDMTPPDEDADDA